MEKYHLPVLLTQTLEYLRPRDGGVYLDGTLGGGGHARAILEMSSPTGRLIGLDQDREAIDQARSVLAHYNERFTAVHANFTQALQALQELEVGPLDGVLLDLGVSSHQLDEAQRGFSYQYDALLDMRMDQSAQLCAQTVVNTYSPERLTQILRDYGEERWAARIAQFICQARQLRPIATTYELVEVIKAAIPAPARREGPHPARRTFQALRIEVNGELTAIARALDPLVNLLKPEGRIAVITFHSLEDRIVKQTFARMENPCTCPPSAPMCICGKKTLVKRVNRKPIEADAEELNENPRARSAKLRVAQRVSNPA